MKKGGLADSPFFKQQQPLVQPGLPTDSSKSADQNTRITAHHKIRSQKKQKPLNRNDKLIPRHHDTKHGITIPRYHNIIIEIIRKAVKEFGKEAATHRFRIEEKKAVSDIIYAYKGRDIKTSENEIARIAINFVIADYEENGEDSVLNKVIKALNT